MTLRVLVTRGYAALLMVPCALATPAVAWAQDAGPPVEGDASAPVDASGKVVGEQFVAVDRAQAGVGDTVLINAEGGGARLVFGRKLTDALAIQDVIVGVVDAFDEG